MKTLMEENYSETILDMNIYEWDSKFANLLGPQIKIPYVQFVTTALWLEWRKVEDFLESSMSLPTRINKLILQYHADEKFALFRWKPLDTYWYYVYRPTRTDKVFAFFAKPLFTLRAALLNLEKIYFWCKRNKARIRKIEICNAIFSVNYEMEIFWLSGQVIAIADGDTYIRVQKSEANIELCETWDQVLTVL